MLNIYLIIHIVSMIYCIWRLAKRYKKSSLDGITGYTPGLDLIMVLILAPVLAIVDIIATAISKFKKNSPIKCDYCSRKVMLWYEAYMFPVKDYKGPVICEDCVKNSANMSMGKNEQIIFV